MQKLYYVVEKELDQGIEETVESTTGNKSIRVYDIDTQSMQMIIFCEIESFNFLNSEFEIQSWLDDNGYSDDEFTFEQL